jgi:LPS-assembly lipoprotein
MRTTPIAVLAAACLLAGGCGFHPLYGGDAVGSGLSRTFSDVYVEPVSDLGVAGTGYELRNSLIDLLDSNSGATYRLKLTLGETTDGIALLQNASITRFNDKLTVKYTLTDSAGAVLTSGTETSLAAYNVVASPYATLAAQQESDKRAAQDIAERIRIDLGVFFEQRKTAAQ